MPDSPHENSPIASFISQVTRKLWPEKVVVAPQSVSIPSTVSQLTDSPQSPRSAADISPLPIRNGKMPVRSKKGAVMTNRPKLVSDEYTRLHADIEHIASPARCFVIGVTSANYGEGKTTIAMDLANTIALNSTTPVALIDCNFRNCDMQTRLDKVSSTGLVHFLEEDIKDMDTIIHATELNNLTVVLAGKVATNPARTARSSHLAEVMNTLRFRNRFVVMDMGPVLPLPESTVLARNVDGIIMVARAGVTPREDTKRAIERVGHDRVLGVVLNGLESSLPGFLQRVIE